MAYNVLIYENSISKNIHQNSKNPSYLSQPFNIIEPITPMFSCRIIIFHYVGHASKQGSTDNTTFVQRQ